MALAERPAVGSHVKLFLVWEEGTETVLDARVARVAQDGWITDLEIHGVRGDWRPWVEFLGQGVVTTS